MFISCCDVQSVNVRYECCNMLSFFTIYVITTYNMLCVTTTYNMLCFSTTYNLLYIITTYNMLYLITTYNMLRFQWRLLSLSRYERRKIVCSVTFHFLAITCVVWSIWVLLQRLIQVYVLSVQRYTKL